MGRILDREFIGERQWYPLGARLLVDSQGKDGSWMDRSDDLSERVLSSSFALLFLTPATAALKPGGKFRGSCGKKVE